jgi:hypothetical protein
MEWLDAGPRELTRYELHENHHSLDGDTEIYIASSITL